MFFLRNQKRNDKQPLSNFEGEIASDTKQLEGQPKKVVAYIKKNVYQRLNEEETPKQNIVRIIFE